MGRVDKVSFKLLKLILIKNAMLVKKFGFESHFLSNSFHISKSISLDRKYWRGVYHKKCNVLFKWSLSSTTLCLKLYGNAGFILRVAIMI